MTKKRSLVAVKPFMVLLFDAYHHTHWSTEPVYTDLRIALFTLRRRTGLTHAQIAIHTGLTTNNIAQIEFTGRPLKQAEAYLNLMELAREYGLTKMREWMRTQYDRQVRNPRMRGKSLPPSPSPGKEGGGSDDKAGHETTYV